MTDNIDTILANPEIDVVVDVLPGAEPSYSYIRRAIEAGKHVVTANKAALASDFGGLISLAKSAGVKLLFEASCGGGMPVIETLKKLTRFDKINAFEGILNGTCNYMLDEMEERGLTFEEALKNAQALGYAEADPTADITGRDVLNKAIIALSLAYGGVVPAELPIRGIVGVTKDFIEARLAEGKHLRLMLISKREGDRFAAGVVPVVVSAASPAANVKQNFNYAKINCDVLGPLSLIAQGAGGRPTADAIVHDLLNCALGTAEEGHVDGSLRVDPSLLTGRAWIGEEVVDAITLEDAVERAAFSERFLAFEPIG